MRDPAREPQSEVGALRLVVVVTPDEVRVLADGQQLRLAPGDLLSRRVGRACQHDAPANAFGIGHRPLQRAHATHRTPQDRRPSGYPELVCESRLSGDLVADRHEGEPAPPRTPVGCWRRRTGRALAAADHWFVLASNVLGGCQGTT